MLGKMYSKANDSVLKIMVGATVLSTHLLGAKSTDSTLNKINNKAETLIGDSKSGIIGLISIVAVILGAVVFLLGVKKAFFDEDRGGEGTAVNGVKMMAGGVLFMALGGIITWFTDNVR